MKHEQPTEEQPDPSLTVLNRTFGPNIVIDPLALDAAEEWASTDPVRLTPPSAVTVHESDDQVIKSGRLAGLGMGAAVVAVAWPVLAESMLNSLVGLVDTIIAAGLSQAATDAVGGAAYMLWFLGLVTMAIGVGATALVSRAMGSGRIAVARAVFGQSFALAAAAGIILAAGIYLATPLLTGLLSMQGPAAVEFHRYLRTMCIGVPFSTIMFALMACSRGAGDTLRPLWAMVVVNIVNLVAAWLLAGGDLRLAGLKISNPVNLHLGVVGIALGTSLAHCVGATMMTVFFLQGRSGVALQRFWMWPHGVTIRRMIRLGLPNFAETFGMWVGNLLVVVMVGWLAADAVITEAAAAAVAGRANTDSAGLIGAHLIGIRIEALSFLPGFAMGVASGALAGQYLGARRPDLARRAAWRCSLIAAAMMGTMGFIFIFFGKQAVGIISQQPAHLALTPQLLFIAGLVQVPFALSIVFRSTMHGAGDVRAVMIMTWLSTWGIRLPLAFFVSGANIHLPETLASALGLQSAIIANPSPLTLGLPGLWMGLCGEIVFRALIYGWRFMDGRWVRAKV